MKRFEDLFAELKGKVDRAESGSGTVAAVERGTHFIGKKLL
jgi:phosphoribosyl-ATP pyrophosphohydrolase